MDFKSLSKKYDMTINEFDSIYQNCYYNTCKRVGKGAEFNDYLSKYLEDTLSSFGIEYRDISKLLDYYIYSPQMQEEDASGAIQTSQDISNTIGMSRKKNPEFKITSPFDEGKVKRIRY